MDKSPGTSKLGTRAAMRITLFGLACAVVTAGLLLSRTPAAAGAEEA